MSLEYVELSSFCTKNEFEYNSFLSLVKRNKINLLKVGTRYYARENELSGFLNNAFTNQTQSTTRKREIASNNARFQKDVIILYQVVKNTKYADAVFNNRSTLKSCAANQYNAQLLLTLKTVNNDITTLSLLRFGGNRNESNDYVLLGYSNSP
jgi:hypothetical protein